MPSDTAPPARIVIVDDHPMIRIGLTQLIGEETDLEVCGECRDAADALPLIESLQPDVVVIDISLENSSGLTLIGDIKKLCKTQRMLVYSMHDELLFAPRALQAGAMGYVNKNSHPRDVVAAIRKILQGRLAVSDRVAETLLATMATATREPGQDSMATLSNRELEVFEFLGRGATIREIAQRLDRSMKTIETHRERIMAKLGLDSSAKLVRRAVEWVTEQDRIQGRQTP